MEYALISALAAGLYVSTKHSKKENFDNLEEQIYSGVEGMENYTGGNGQEEDNENENENPINGNAVNCVQNHNVRDKYYNNDSIRQVYNNMQSQKQVAGLNGETIDPTTFKHNNMQPFFGGKIRGAGPNINTSESILDNKTGSGSQSVAKQEQAPLFKPDENVQFAYGAPNASDFYQSRVNPSNRHANVKPFESVQVGPGLNQGFENTAGSGGFNSGLEHRDTYMPKSVDELRVATNPKNTYELDGHQGPAASRIQNISDVSHQGKIEKHRPDTYYENTSDRWFTTTGAVKANTQRAPVELRDVTRPETSTSYSGNASAQVDGVVYHKNNYQESTKNVYRSPNIGIAAAEGQAHGSKTDHGKKSYKSYLTNRDNQSETHMFGNLSTAVNAAIAPLMDILRPSRKENVVGNNRPYGNAHGAVEETYVMNYNDKPRVTNRQMDTGNKNQTGNMQRQTNAGYLNSNVEAVHGNREETTQYYTGAGVSAHKEVQPYESAYAVESNPYKEKTLTGRAPNGNTSMLNHEVNISVAKPEEDRNNNRMWVPSKGSVLPPSTQNFGAMDMPMYNNPETNKFNDQRIDPGLLDAFKSNPYTHSLSSTNY